MRFGPAPPLRRQLLNGDGTAIDLTLVTSVNILIAHARYDHTYSPYPPIVPWDACAIEAPEVDGYVQWIPGIVRGVDALWLPGTFQYIFEINFDSGARQTVGPNTYEHLHVRTKPGGFIQDEADIPG